MSEHGVHMWAYHKLIHTCEGRLLKDGQGVRVGVQPPIISVIRTSFEVVVVLQELEIFPHRIKGVGVVIESIGKVVEIMLCDVNKVDKSVVKSTTTKSTSAGIPSR